MEWRFNRKGPVFIQIADILRLSIVTGEYTSDQQIPPVRQLAFEAAVNPNTMQKALSLLEEEGILCARGTSGRFVTSDQAVLDAEREKMRRQTVQRWIADAGLLGISKEELIEYIKEETQL